MIIVPTYTPSNLSPILESGRYILSYNEVIGALSGQIIDQILRVSLVLFGYVLFNTLIMREDNKISVKIPKKIKVLASDIFDFTAITISLYLIIITIGYKSGL